MGRSPTRPAGAPRSTSWPSCSSSRISAQQRPGVEALDGDHPDPRQRDRERPDVVLEVEELQALALQLGERAAHELAEPQQPDATAGSAQERGDLRGEVAVMAGEQDVALPALRERVERALDRDVDDL